MTNQAQAHAGDKRVYKRGRGKNKTAHYRNRNQQRGMSIEDGTAQAKTFRLDGV